MTLLLDNYDSFTYNLKDYLEQAGEHCIVIRNDELNLRDIQQLKFDNIVLSPGPKTPAEAGCMNEVIEAFMDKKPILGICLGHQALGILFDGELVKADYPMHGKISEISHTAHPIFADIPSPTEVMRYHSLLIKNLDHPHVEIIAKTSRGEIMAMAHKHKPLAGLQFHPESILTTHGKKMIQNWLKFIS